jgi:hypothetical protein
MRVMRVLSWLRRHALHACLLGCGLIIEQPIVARMTGQATASAAEDLMVNEPQQPQTDALMAGHIATSTVGEVGQRQTADTTAIGIRPGARIENRIQNRVQTRVQNRIDKNYNPLMRATDTFAVAAQQGQASGGN